MIEFNRTPEAIDIEVQYGGIDGDHHKEWDKAEIDIRFE